jgi:ABC-2 type transport system permease protein
MATTIAAAARRRGPARRRRPGALTVYRWELTKLAHQKRTYLGLAFAVAMPAFFVVSLQFQSGSPGEVAFGGYVRDSGLAIPLVLLAFGSGFVFPLITALVAGDILASEDHNGTLKTILTRSLDRGHVFTGKALAAATYALAAVVAMGAVAVGAGVGASGYHALISLSGQVVAPTRALGLVAASFGVYLVPLLAVTCIGLLLSSAMHNSAGAVVATLMVVLITELVSILPGTEAAVPYLITTQFEAWHGLLRTPTDWAPIVRAAWVCALWGLPPLGAAYLVLVRRDVAGG